LNNALLNVLGYVENANRYACYGIPYPERETGMETSPGSHVNAEIRAFAAQALRIPKISEAIHDLTICHSICVLFADHQLGPCYPLNLLLAEMFHQEIEKISRWKILRPQHLVVHLERLPEGDGYYLVPHRVWFEQANIRGEIECQIVVPRLGVDPATIPSERGAALLQHILPYWLPDWKPTGISELPQ
jgi:hypothetical protein